MSAALLTLLIGFGQGLLHGLGPDHCAAVATLGALDRRRGAALRIALRFAIGHALVLGLIAGGCLALGVMVSESFERWAELLGGAVLVTVAVAATFFPELLEHGHPAKTRHAHEHAHDGDVHAHAHAHEATEMHAHPAAHAHAHRRPVRVEGAAGALMAVSGARSLIVAVPPLVVGGAFSIGAWVYLPAFAVGVLLSMAVVGLIVSGGMSRLGPVWAARAQRAIAVASAALGLMWIFSRV